MSYLVNQTYPDPNTSRGADQNHPAKKLLFVISQASYVLSHRLSLAQSAREKGYDVSLATADSQETNLIEKEGFQVYRLKHLHRSNLSPFKQFAALKELVTLYKNLRPDIVHHVAMKPVLYGAFAAQQAQVPRVINAFGGLGYLFSSPSLRAQILQAGIQLPMRRALAQPNSTLILQNQDDEALLRQRGFLAGQNVTLIPGAGVDTHLYAPRESPQKENKGASSPLKIVFVGRLLWDKGVRELCEAAVRIHQDVHSVEIDLYGDIDPQNPLSLTLGDVDKLTKQFPVHFKGATQDVASVYQQADMAVLPSYREGMPKSLLEAASCGLPLVTTDVPGCREVVVHGENGLLVPPQDPGALADALLHLCHHKSLRDQQGLASRKRVLSFFSQESINKQTLALYEESTDIVCEGTG